MWKLTIEDDEGQRTSLELAQKSYAIGRAEDASIRLTERNVSRSHATLTLNGDGWMIADGGSYNGTYVNGERVIENVSFGTGDVLHVGDYRMELMDAVAVSEQQQQAAAQVDPSRSRRPDRLVVVIGPVPGVEFALDGDRLTIGRAEEASLSLNHASVSRVHAELVSLGERRWECIDQGSSNGIRINGVDLRRGIIEPGDALELGDVRLRFVAEGKYFRPAVDLSQQLPVVVPFEGMAPSGGGATVHGQSGSVGKIVAVAAVLVVLLIGGYVMLTGTNDSDAGPTANEEPMAANETEARLLLKQAATFAAEGDVPVAHKMLARIPESSPVRESPEFKEIENNWADFMFGKADATDDVDEKRKIYNAIADTTTLGAERRQKALDFARALGPAPGGTAAYPSTISPLGPSAASARAPSGSATATGTDDEVYPDSPPPPPEPESSGSAAKYDENAQKKRLYPRVAAGTASETEIRMLRAICSNQGDRACRNMASAKLKELKK